MKYMFRSACYLQKYQKERDLQRRLPYLISSEKDCIEALNIFRDVQSAQQIFTARHWLARIHVECWEFYGVKVDQIFRSLEACELVANMLRKELSALGGLPALLQKQRFTSGKEVQDVYSWAAGISLREKRYQDLWNWSQKRKARSLSDMLGLGILIPESVRKSVSANRDTQDLFDQLKSLTKSLANAADNERGYIRQHIDDVEDRLKTNDAFRDFLALRDGTIQELTQLENLKEKDKVLETGRKVIWIDFIIHRDNVHMLIIDCEGMAESCAWFLLPLGATAIQSWTLQYFANDVTRRDSLKNDYVTENSSALRKLDPIIAPLANSSREGDLLIFSGTGVISSLPLHALKIDEDGTRGPRSLIERNPVVYAPSFPVMEVCVARSLNERPNTTPVFLSNFDSAEEAQTIHSQLQKVARRWNAQCAYGEDLTTTSFAEFASSASLIHYHGHCVYSADNVLKQALVLGSPGADSTETLTEESTSAGQVMRPELGANSIKQVQKIAKEDRLLQLPIKDTGTHFTVEDIFKLQLGSPLVVLIACESASQSISAGDEPLGLIAGLLCAGAASVIGASWPIPSSAGRAFTEAFYKQIDESTCQSFIDLAVALQQAVLDIMDDPLNSSTYYWGAFCLNGSWIHRS